MDPRSLPKRTRIAIAKGYLRANAPQEITESGEREAERRYYGEDRLEDGYDVGDHGYDPGDDRPA